MKSYSILILILFWGSFQTNLAVAQGQPFNCTSDAYLFQRNDVYALNLASGSSWLAAKDITEANINGTGYNPTDGYIYGFLKSPSGTIVKIGDDFNVTTIQLTGFPAGNNYVGDISSDGIYYLKSSGTTFHRVDLNPSSGNYGQYLGASSLSKSINIHDWAYNAADDLIYAVEKGTNMLYRISPLDGLVTPLGVVPLLSGFSYTYGACYFDVDGNFYVSSNQTGTIYMIPAVQTIPENSTFSAIVFADGPASGSNDGARCPTAPVPQELCFNGLDDDGDGMVDCEDPACKGLEECNTSEKSISSGNDGGLESNSRLGEQIATRNFNRMKSGFRFNAQKAPRFVKQNITQTKSLELDLVSFIPEDAIEGAIAVESSASDLIQITNATELLSVDFVKDQKTVAVILATKTENGVYEHTKYICDRLLGGELLSVSTVEIAGQNFIKSLTQNPDGSQEFVLSFSGYLNTADSNWTVDGHWNVDKYETQTSYYNFQIWANNIDDLLVLGEATLGLMETHFPISTYNLSEPPPIFVKRGQYNSGSLELDIVNSTGKDTILFSAGMQLTETTELENLSGRLTMEEAFITSTAIETGNLFSIGLRLESDSGQTPDDLFLSDGAWGVYSETEGTTVLNYEITPKEEGFEPRGFPVERGVHLHVETSSFVSLFRGFTPRFQAMNLDEYNTLEFDAFGVGELEITLMKAGVELWEGQYRTTISLTPEKQHYKLSKNLFTSTTGGSMQWQDVVSLVFMMSSEGQSPESKEVYLQNLEFTFKANLDPKGELTKGSLRIIPNPIDDNGTIQVLSDVQELFVIQFVDIHGRVVQSMEMEMQAGINEIGFSKGDLKPGVYTINMHSATQKIEGEQVMIR